MRSYFEFNLAAILVRRDCGSTKRYCGNIVLILDSIRISRLLRIRNSIWDALAVGFDAFVHEAIFVNDFDLLLELNVFVHGSDLVLLKVFEVQDWYRTLMSLSLLLILFLLSLLCLLHLNLFKELDLFRVDT